MLCIADGLSSKSSKFTKRHHQNILFQTIDAAFFLAQQALTFSLDQNSRYHVEARNIHDSRRADS